VPGEYHCVSFLHHRSAKSRFQWLRGPRRGTEAPHLLGITGSSPAGGMDVCF